MASINLQEWEEQATKSLLQKLMQLSILACLLTLVFEYFFPHGLDYVVTIGFLIISTAGFAACIAGYEKIAANAFIIGGLTLFTTMDWGFNHRYYSAFKVFSIGMVFAFVVLRKNKVILFYLVLITFLECLSVYSFLLHNNNGDQILLVYEWIHVIAYNIGFTFMCYFFVRNITAHRIKIQQAEIDNQQLAIQLADKKNEALQNLLLGQEEERHRLSQDIHDGISIHLAQFKSHLKSFSAAHKNSSTENLIENLTGIQEDLRNISHALSPTLLQNFGLKKAINDLIFQIESTNPDIDINFHFSIQLHTKGGHGSLNKEHEKHLYYITQELLNNAIKHSRAKKISLSLHPIRETGSLNKDGKIQLVFFDNGKGFEMNHLNGEGIGIKNIQSRVAVMGGKFDVSRKENGMEQVVII